MSGPDAGELLIAGATLEVGKAADELLHGPDSVDESGGYPLLTLKHYDHGWTSARQDERIGSPRDRVSVHDLGRATLFGAFRGWKAPTKLFLAAGDASVPWPTSDADWKLDAEPSLDDQSWLGRDDVNTAWSLYSALASGSLGGWRGAAASKVLHLKWPDFYPVLDGELLDLYSEAAWEREQSIPGSRRRKHPSTRAYWLAIRADLIDNRQALGALRSQLRHHDGDETDRARLLSELTDLRLMDCVAWLCEPNAGR